MLLLSHVMFVWFWDRERCDGKACLVSAAKSYDLTMMLSIIHHPQIAPDLCDGKCERSVYSDVMCIRLVES